ncbi:carbohydrate-binding module family 19 protein [Backusella circina FSU 941]|nr:carbohydrate-binding module family 19 protein [Backusella circina FSU 941]
MLFSRSYFICVSSAILLILNKTEASFFDKPGIATYWGQNSANGANTQKPLREYCDGSSDMIIMSFLLDFRNGDLPVLNLANSCDGPSFQGTSLLECTDIGADIKSCQKKGKSVLMSLGGAAGSYGFVNDKDAEAFADTLWNTFGGGSSKTRPFGNAVLDGFDLDIEGGGPTGYSSMVKQLRSHFKKDSSRDYYITAAPQCPFPDAMLGDALEKVEFDAVNVQFYNNYCSTTSSNFNFDTWDDWAKNKSPNKNVKILLGIPGSKEAAGTGYVPFKSLEPIVKDVQKKYSSFGGVMIWDASTSYANSDVSPNYAVAVADLVHGLSKNGDNHSSSPTKGHGTTSKSATETKSIKTKTTKTKSTETTFSTKPSNGKSCSSEGKMTCSGNSFATCSSGSWSLRPCPKGLTCFGTTDGGSIYCGQSEKSSNSITVSSLSLTDNSRGPIAMPYNSGRVTAQFSVKQNDVKSFSAVINAGRLDLNPFKSTVTIQFKVADNIKVTKVANGKVTQTGNNVKLTVKNLKEETMSLLTIIDGTVHSGVFSLPSINSMRFS